MRKARIVYPRLCQSIMTREPRSREASRTMKSVGRAGGVCSANQPRLSSLSCVKQLTCTRISSGGGSMRAVMARKSEMLCHSTLKGATSRKAERGRREMKVGGAGR